MFVLICGVLIARCKCTPDCKLIIDLAHLDKLLNKQKQKSHAVEHECQKSNEMNKAGPACLVCSGLQC